MPNRSNAGSHDWSDLSAGMKAHYTNQGITAATYNRWWRMPQIDRTNLTIEAKEHGYQNGLNFLAVQAQVRRTTGKTITPRTDPREAARKMIKGTKGKESKRQRNLVPKLFDFSDFETYSHEAWTNFLSP